MAVDGENDRQANMADIDDEWVLGMFYYSPNPAIVVPSAWGPDTLNMAHPLVWLICAALAPLLIVGPRIAHYLQVESTMDVLLEWPDNRQADMNEFKFAVSER